MRCARLVRDPVLFFPAVRSVVRVFLRIAFASHLNRQRQTIGHTLAYRLTHTSTLDTRTPKLPHTTFAFQSLALLTAAPAAAATARAVRCCCRSCVCLCPPARRWSFYSPLSLDSFFTWHFSTFPFAIVISAFVGCVCLCTLGGSGGMGWWANGWLRAWSILLSCFLFKTICLA